MTVAARIDQLVAIRRANVHKRLTLTHLEVTLIESILDRLYRERVRQTTDSLSIRQADAFAARFLKPV